MLILRHNTLSSEDLFVIERVSKKKEQFTIHVFIHNWHLVHDQGSRSQIPSQRFKPFHSS
jgi:hypothetical protein